MHEKTFFWRRNAFSQRRSVIEKSNFGMFSGMLLGCVTHEMNARCRTNIFGANTARVACHKSLISRVFLDARRTTDDDDDDDDGDDGVGDGDDKEGRGDPSQGHLVVLVPPSWGTGLPADRTREHERKRKQSRQGSSTGKGSRTQLLLLALLGSLLG